MFYQTHTARRPPKGPRMSFLSRVTLTSDLWFSNLRTRPSEGPNTSSVWIWRKSVQRFPVRTQTKKVTDSAKNRTLRSWLRAVRDTVWSERRMRTAESRTHQSERGRWSVCWRRRQGDWSRCCQEAGRHVSSRSSSLCRTVFYRCRRAEIEDTKMKCEKESVTVTHARPTTVNAELNYGGWKTQMCVHYSAGSFVQRFSSPHFCQWLTYFSCVEFDCIFMLILCHNRGVVRLKTCWLKDCTLMPGLG